MVFEFEDKKHGHSFMVAHDVIIRLSMAQGCYSRLRIDMENSEWWPLYELTAEVYFEEPLDFILYIEN